jgi:hypothetical protein
MRDWGADRKWQSEQPARVSLRLKLVILPRKIEHLLSETEGKPVISSPMNCHWLTAHAHEPSSVGARLI